MLTLVDTEANQLSEHQWFGANTQQTGSDRETLHHLQEGSYTDYFSDLAENSTQQATCYLN